MAVVTARTTDPQKVTLLISAVNKHDNKSTLSFPDGTVVSVQPSSTPEVPVIEFRPSGAAGAFEQCDVMGQTATYWYDWNGATVGPIVIAFTLSTGKSK